MAEGSGNSWTLTTLNLVAVLLTAAATCFAAYAAYLANRSAENIAALQAISQWTSSISQYSKGGACAVVLVNANDLAAMALFLQKKPFSMKFDGTSGEMKRCLGRDPVTASNNSDGATQRTSQVAQREIVISAEDADSIYQQIFNRLNGYEAILAYWHQQVGNRQIICAEVLPGFNRYVRPMLVTLKELKEKGNPDAKSLVDGYPAIEEFSHVSRCEAGA